VLSVGAGPEAQSIMKRMEREATHRYQTLTLPEDKAANCLFVNGSLIHRGKLEAPKSHPVSECENENVKNYANRLFQTFTNIHVCSALIWLGCDSCTPLGYRYTSNTDKDFINTLYKRSLNLHIRPLYSRIVKVYLTHASKAHF
jgi:hypothetical protein